MGAVYQDFTYTTNSISTSIAATKPAAATTDDLLIAFCTCSVAVTWTAPSGWTQAGTQSSQGAVFWRIVGSSPGSDGATYTFSQGSVANNRVTIARFNASHLTAPIDDIYQATASASNAVDSSITAAHADTTLFAFINLAGSTSAVTIPSGMTSAFNSTTSQTKAGAYETGVGTGATGTRTWTNNTTTYTTAFLAIRTGTTAYSQTPSDTATSSDTAAKTVAHPATDAATATDAAVRSPRKNPTDSVVSSDAITTKGVVKGLADTATSSDASGRTVGKLAAPDSATASDTSTRTVGRQPSDTVTSSDAKTATFAKVLTDSPTALEDITLILGSIRSINEVAEAVDLASKAITPGAKTDSVSMSELAARLVGKGFTDSSAASDVATRLVAYLRTFTDAATPTDAPSKHISLRFSDVVGAVSDWPVNVPTRVIAGVVRHHETGALVEAATIRLFRTTDDAICQTTLSAANGSYSFSRDRDDPYDYYVTAQYLDSGVQVHGITDRGLIPEVA